MSAQKSEILIAALERGLLRGWSLAGGPEGEVKARKTVCLEVILNPWMDGEGVRQLYGKLCDVCRCHVPPHSRDIDDSFIWERQAEMEEMEKRRSEARGTRTRGRQQQSPPK